MDTLDYWGKAKDIYMVYVTKLNQGIKCEDWWRNTWRRQSSRVQEQLKECEKLYGYVANFHDRKSRGESPPAFYTDRAYLYRPENEGVREADSRGSKKGARRK